MTNLISERILRKYMTILAIFVTGVIFGYLWHFMAVLS